MVKHFLTNERQAGNIKGEGSYSFPQEEKKDILGKKNQFLQSQSDCAEKTRLCFQHGSHQQHVAI